MKNEIKLKDGRFLNDEYFNVIENFIISFNQAINNSNPKKLTYKYLNKLFENGFFSKNGDYDLRNKNIIVFSFGKCAHLMAEGLIDFMGPEKDMELLISSPHLDDYNPKHGYKDYCYKGSHPYSDINSIQAGSKAFDLAKNAGKESIVICLISGGGSAMFENLKDNFSLDDAIELSNVMLNLGMEDHEINIFRKIISKVKGGKLAQIIYPSPILNMIISDDAANELEAIASGPTIPNSATLKDVKKLIGKWKLRKHLSKNLFNKIDEEIKIFENSNDSFSYPNIETRIILDNKKFISNLKNTIKKNDSHSIIFMYDKILRKSIDDCSRELSNFIIHKYPKIGNNNIYILAGGEIPVKAIKNTKGGRNQHFSVVMLRHLKSIAKKWAFFSIATDGCDYIKGIAGSYVTSDLKEYLNTKNIQIDSYIDNTNSYSFHRDFGTHLVCNKGTGMNVSDIYIFIST